MNRLILIGNGFDLAHGLKTSYYDFILDYFKECCINSLEKLKLLNQVSANFILYEDLLISIKIISKNSIVFEFDIPRFEDNTINAIRDCNSTEDIVDILSKLKILIKYNGYGFPESILKSINSKKWVDIESLYYEGLKKCLKEHIAHKSTHNSDFQTIERLTYLNNQLDFIKDKLINYLSEIEKNNTKKINELNEILNSGLVVKNLKTDKGTVSIDDSVLLLNFNYTKTPVRYISNDKFDIVNIHGELNNTENQIIFGYGDEVDKYYKEIEDLNENEFFKHIKSFDYFKTSNYSKLLAFLDNDEFEVFTMGHSCGLSDRTMLSTIFEHPNCKSIKIFFHENYNDYRNKTYEISRHFNDKLAMRDKIVPFSKCIRMPQHNYK